MRLFIQWRAGSERPRIGSAPAWSSPGARRRSERELAVHAAIGAGPGDTCTATPRRGRTARAHRRSWGMVSQHCGIPHRRESDWTACRTSDGVSTSTAMGRVGVQRIYRHAAHSNGRVRQGIADYRVPLVRGDSFMLAVPPRALCGTTTTPKTALNSAMASTYFWSSTPEAREWGVGPVRAR